MAEVAGQGARLVPVGDAAALAASIAEVIDSSESDRGAWAQRARLRAEQFSWEACVDQHLVAYERALEVR
jgi:glycosyltransferase involved in cell wall biosynthesis